MSPSRYMVRVKCLVKITKAMQLRFTHKLTVNNSGTFIPIGLLCSEIYP